MFRNFILLASVAGALTLSAAAPSAQAQGLEDTRSHEQFCRDLDADAGFADANSSARQAQKEFEQASKWDELAANAQANANASSDPKDQESWNSRAKSHRDNAKALRDAANRNLERAKLARAKFRNNCDLSDQAFESLDGYLGGEILIAEFIANPDAQPADDEKFERPKQEKAEKSSTQERKTAEKTKPEKRVIGKPKVKTNRVTANDETAKIVKRRLVAAKANDEAAINATRLALGIAGEVLHRKAMRKHHREAMSNDNGYEEMGKMHKMGKMKKMKKFKKLHKLAKVGSMMQFGF